MFLDKPSAHQSTRFFGVEADDFKGAVFLIFKHWRNDPGIELLGIYRFEVLIRGEINQHVGASFSNGFIKCRCKDGLPIGIQILTGTVRQLGAHFKTVGLNQIQRP